MIRYILKRLLFIPPEVLIIFTINFFLMNLALPGGPLEIVLASMRGEKGQATDRIKGLSESRDVKDFGGDIDSRADKRAKWMKGMNVETLEALKKRFHMDKPLHVRYFLMLKGFCKGDFGESLFQEVSVFDLVKERLPVSASLGVWSTILIYSISVGLGMTKAKKHLSRFDSVSDTILISLKATPSFLLAVLSIILFCGGSYWKIFPLGGLFSDNIAELSLFGKIMDYFWHLVLPVSCMVIPSCTVLSDMVKNFFLEELNKPYVSTARMKGCSEARVMMGHIFRNAMLIIIARFPAIFIGMFFTGSLLLEVVFNLRGLGLLGFTAVINRDFPIILGTLVAFQIIGLLIKLVCDMTYKLADPRIDFEKRRA